jgi:hypothetical protein
MNGVLCLWLAALDVLILISFQAGNFEESAEAITLLWPYALSIPSVYIKMISFLLIVIDHARVIAIPILSSFDELRSSDLARSCLRARVIAFFTRSNIFLRVMLHRDSLMTSPPSSLQQESGQKSLQEVCRPQSPE